MEEQEPPEQIVKRLMAAVKCTACGSPYENDRIKVLGHRDELWFLTVTCSRCHTQSLVAALLKDASGHSATLTRISVPGEPLPPQEVTPESDEETPPKPITTDDVLDMHQFLQDFDGDFSRHFGSSGRRTPN